jgi:hypothetical protein
VRQWVVLLLALMVCGTASADGMHSTSGVVFPHHGSSHNDRPSTVFASFSWDPTATGAGSGPSQLSSSLTIGGTTVVPFLEYLGKNAADPTWTASAGPNLTKTARGGANVTVGAAVAATESAARGAKPAAAGASGETWQAASAASTTVTTGDLVFEGWLQSATSLDTIFATYADAVGNGGYELDSTGRVVLADGTNLASVASGTCPAGSWCHVIAFCDWGVQCTSYINGASPTTASIAAITTLTAGTPGKLTVGSRSTISSSFCTGCNIGFFRMWVGPTSWFSSSTQAAVALERAARVWGFYPQVAAGASTPLNMTRATTQTCDIDRDGDGIVRLFTLGNNALCIARRKDALAAYAAGYRVENQATNLALQSQTLDAWALFSAETSISANALAAPDATTTADGLVGDATNATHEIRLTTTSSMTSATTYTYSAWLKQGNQPAARLRLSSTVSSGACWRLDTCAFVGDAGLTTPITAHSEENFGNGWCRVSFSVAATTTTTIAQYIASSDDVSSCVSGSEAFTGDAATINTYAWGVQIETGSVPTSYIATTTATATRNATDLRYSSATNVSAALGSEVVSFLSPVDTTGANRVLTTVGTSSNDSMMFAASSTAPTWNGTSGGVTQWAITGTSNPNSDGKIHTLRATYNTNDIHYYYDGTQEGTPDVVATVPAFGATLFVGERETGTLQPPSLLITKLVLYPTVIPGSVGAP